MARQRPARTAPALPAPPRPAARGARLWLFRLLSATALPVLLLASLEGALRFAGLGEDTGFTIPCSVQGRPARCDNPDFSRQFFPPGMARQPTPFAFPDEKGPRTFRIFVLGESAAQGDPEPAFGFARFLEVMLRARFPSVRFEVVNSGVPAISSHVVLQVARDLAGRGGDLFLVYAGNNEVVGPFGNGTVLTQRLPSLGLVRASIFVRGLRLGQLLGRALRLGRPGPPPRQWGGMAMFLEQQVRESDPSLITVGENFRSNLRDAVAAARGAGAQVIVSTVGTRLRGCAPFSSLHAPGLAKASLQEWEATVGRGALLEAEGRCREALPDYLAAAAIDNTFAELEYRRARCAYAQGDYGIAAAGYARARDLDTLRFRADTRIDRIIREVAGEPGAGVTFIDGAAALAQASDHGVIDGALFYEHAHLTPAGNYQLAKALFPAVAAALPPALRGPGEPPAPLAEPEAHARLALTGFDRYRVAKEVLDRLSRPPFTQQLDHQAQLVELAAERDRGAAEAFAESDARYRAAIAQAPDDPWLRLGHGILLDTRDVFLARRGGQDQGAALAPYQKALELLPNLTPARFRLAEALLRLGRPNEAVAQCQALLAARPGHAPAYKTMGLALSRMEKPAEALAAWQRALALDPSTSGEALVEIGRLQLGLHRASEAAQSFRRALADGQGGGELQLQLGAALRAAGRSGEARQALGEAARSFRAEQKADPASAKAHTGLANTLVEQGDLAGAAEEFARAASLQPEDPAPRWSLVGVLALAGRREEAARTARAAAQALRALGRAADAETFEAREREIEAGRR